MSRPKTYPKCVAPGCTQRGDYARGFCQIHYGQFRLACQRNGSWKDEDERDYVQRLLTHPEIKPFEWEGDEEALAAMTEAQEQEREKQAREKQSLDSPKGE